MKETGFDLLCIGNAMVDVFAKDAEQIHIRYGISEPVQHVEIERIEKILACFDEYTAVSGGGAANVAKIAGFLGAKAYFTGAAGNDNFALLFEKDLTAAGVTLALRKKTMSTGICLILRTKEGNTHIAASPSASLEFSENDIREDDIKKAKLIVIDGFMLGRQNLVRHILRLAVQHEKPVAIDLSSPYIAAEMAKEIENYARRYPLILFMNEEEAKAFYAGLKRQYPKYLSRRRKHKAQRKIKLFLTGALRLCGCANTFRNGRFSISRNKREFPIIVVKQGERGAICFARGKIYQSETKAITPVDATSAGDAFCAGFLTAWARGKSLTECGALGNKTAALVLGVEGSQLTKNSGPGEPLFSK